MKRIRSASAVKSSPPPGAAWTFLTNHSHVLLCLTNDPDMLLREVAVRVGITERAVQKIVADLTDGGVLIREKVGRRNHYRINRNVPLRHSIEAHRTVADIVRMVAGKPART
jgi:DNA-binding Lrp family transcriptional regulator